MRWLTIIPTQSGKKTLEQVGERTHLYLKNLAIQLFEQKPHSINLRVEHNETGIHFQHQRNITMNPTLN